MNDAAKLCADRVWPMVEKQHPLFTHAHDSFNDPWAVEVLVLGESIGFQSFPGAQVMDVGANVGVWTALCAVEGAEVTAYEADPVTYAVLTEMLARTNLQVMAINKAIWTHNGECPFRGYEKGNDVRLRNGNVLREIAAWMVRVPCLTFEEALGDKVWDCIKVDIEGAEFEILASTPLDVLRDHIRYMALEIHHEWTPERAKYDSFIRRLGEVFDITGFVAVAGDPWESRLHWAQLRNKVKI